MILNSIYVTVLMVILSASKLSNISHLIFHCLFKWNVMIIYKTLSLYHFNALNVFKRDKIIITFLYSSLCYNICHNFLNLVFVF